MTSRVDPSMSVKRNVTAPVGGSTMARSVTRPLDRWQERPEPGVRRRRRAARPAGRSGAARGGATAGDGARTQTSAAVELAERPPADLAHALGAELLGRETRADRERAAPDQVVPLRLAVEAAAHREDVRPHPDAPPEGLDELQTELLAELARERRGVVLALLHPAPGRRPDRTIGVVEADERDPLVGVEDERPDAGTEPHATSERSARNHASRSSQGTAAFAGEVDGRTNRSVSPRLASWRPCCGRPPKGPR